MHVTLFCASSLDGFIARKNGTEDFLSEVNWKTFCSLAAECGGFIAGRKTYDAVARWDDVAFADVPVPLKIIVSHTSESREGFTYVLSPRDALATAAAHGLTNVLLVGGSTLTASFFDENLIDEVILNIEPVLLGNGITLVAHGISDQRLVLVASRQLDDGIVQVHYRVKK